MNSAFYPFSMRLQPSIVVLDDLDVLTPVETPDMRSDKVRGRAITEKVLLLNCFSDISQILNNLRLLAQNLHQVSVIITAQDVRKLNPILTRPDLAPLQLEIMAPNQEERKQILEKLLGLDKVVDSVTLSYYAIEPTTATKYR